MEKKEVKRVTTHVLQQFKNQKEPVSVLTAYDFSMAGIFDEAGVEVLLVGDSAANVMAGFSTTLPITLEHMIFMASSVVRAAKRAMVVVDLPFGSYEESPEKALQSAIRIIKESGAQAVKLEGGEEMTGTIKKIVDAGIPVMGHLGLVPQSINKFGSYSVRAKEEAEADKLLKDAGKIEAAGCFSVVLEKIPAQLAGEVTAQLKIPTIGIGAGGEVDGQVLVMHDMLGINKGFSPKFLRRYADLYPEIKNAVAQYVADVKNHDFPNEKEQY